MKFIQSLLTPGTTATNSSSSSTTTSTGDGSRKPTTKTESSLSHPSSTLKTTLIDQRAHLQSQLESALQPSTDKINLAMPTASTPSAPKSPPDWDEKDGHLKLEMGSYITDRYKMIRLLGQGTFGKVVECWDELASRSVAIKIIKAIPKYREAAKLEIRVLETLRQHDPENRK